MTAFTMVSLKFINIHIQNQSIDNSKIGGKNGNKISVSTLHKCTNLGAASTNNLEFMQNANVHLSCGQTCLEIMVYARNSYIHISLCFARFKEEKNTRILLDRI